MRLAPMTALVTLLLGGCAAVGPDYAGRPASSADTVAAYPAADDGAEAAPTAEPAATWWRALDDAVLNELIAAAIDANYDVRVAVANVEGARAALAAVTTRRVPNLDLNATVQEKRDASGLLVVADPDNRFPTISSGSFSLDLGWEIDLFGRVRRSVEAAAADLGSLEAVRNAVLTTVLADVARAYVDLRGAQVRRAVAERNVGVQRQTLELVTVLNREGAATELDLERARTQLLSSEATIPNLRTAERAALNRLGTLTGRAPGTLGDALAQSAPLPVIPDVVAVGTPADLLRRRPDIQIAERALAAAAARIGVATADLFPTVSLGGRVGLGGAPLSSLGSPGSPFFALGPSITWNLFDRRAIYARIRQQDSVAAANLARYEAAVTTALEEVDSNLTAWLNERDRRARLAAARDASRNASYLARLRYQEGVEDFLAVLDAERNLLAIEDQLAVSEIELARGLVGIHLALGTGWQDSPAPAYVSPFPSD